MRLAFEHLYLAIGMQLQPGFTLEDSYRLTTTLPFLLLLLLFMLRLVIFVMSLCFWRRGRRDGRPVTLAQMMMILHLSHCW